MTIQIPDDLARGLEGIAAAQKKSVQQLAVDRLRSLLDKPTSPEAVLRTIQALPHPSPSAVDDLDAAIAASRLPVRDQGAQSENKRGGNKNGDEDLELAGEQAVPKLDAPAPAQPDTRRSNVLTHPVYIAA